jgi:hypothetical protein
MDFLLRLLVAGTHGAPPRPSAGRAQAPGGMRSHASLRPERPPSGSTSSTPPLRRPAQRAERCPRGPASWPARRVGTATLEVWCRDLNWWRPLLALPGEQGIERRPDVLTFTARSPPTSCNWSARSASCCRSPPQRPSATSSSSSATWRPTAPADGSSRRRTGCPMAAPHGTGRTSSSATPATGFSRDTGYGSRWRAAASPCTSGTPEEPNTRGSRATPRAALNGSPHTHQRRDS